MGLLHCLLLLLAISVNLFSGAHAVSSNPATVATPSVQQNAISLHFANIEVSGLLHELARLGDTNFLLSESIQGRMSETMPHCLLGVTTSTVQSKF
jgi:type IV pilus assembly protein PilQ